MLAIWLIACQPSTEATSVLWISLDTVGAQYLSLYGGNARTPVIDRFADEARVYDQAFTHFPETSIAHWTMFTGVYPEVHGDVPRQGNSEYTGKTAAQILGAAGYSTAAWTEGPTMQEGGTGLNRGFTFFRNAKTREDRGPACAGQIGQATDWVRRQQGKFFAFVHCFDAHTPYTQGDRRTVSSRLRSRFAADMRSIEPIRDGREAATPEVLHDAQLLYEAEITALDAALAPLLAAAKPDTVVVITADHGESFTAEYPFNHSGSLFDEVLRVPLVIRVPGGKRGRDDRLVGLADLLPTVLGALGVPHEQPMQGIDVNSGAERSAVWALTDPTSTRQRIAGPLAGPLLAQRTHGMLLLSGKNGTVSYNLDDDPQHRKPLPSVMDREPYDQAIAAMAHYRRAIGVPDHALPLEALEALGYVHRAGPPR